MPTEIVVCPIVREPDGLAMSSRNVYLSADQRKQALALSRAIGVVESLVGHGQRDREELVEAARAVFGAEPQVRVDYIALVDWATLQPVDTATPGTLFAVAAWVGETRLIDNTILS
jgi:pantoate--beta-alanine ligase